MTSSASYLLPIADRSALAWILRDQRTAFGQHRVRDARALTVGDVLLLYTTRGCFRNPTRDRGRVIGRATVKSRAREASRPLSFGGREFPHVVELEIETLARFGEGLELAPLVRGLKRTFPNSKTWSARMRRALVPLDPQDAVALERQLKGVARPYPDALPTYGGTGT